MTQTNVLHITDLHIEFPEGTEEVLRSKFYSEYLDGLIDNVKAEQALRPHIMVVNGDFVHKGPTHTPNGEHAYAVLSHIANAFDLSFKDVVVGCVGNHDVDWGADSKAHPSGSREWVNAFLAKMGNGKATTHIDNRASLVSVCDNVDCLILDATIRGSRDRAGDLEDHEVDDIVDLVKNLPNDQLLVIASHYPPMISQDFVGDYLSSEANFAERHLWRSGKPLRERIIRLRERQGRQTLWLSGDIHEPDQCVMGSGQYSVVTGRIGGKIPQDDSAVFRQARIVSLNVGGKEEAKVATLNYTARGHKQNAHLGEWKIEHSGFRRQQRRDDSPSKTGSVTPVAGRIGDDVGTESAVRVATHSDLMPVQCVGDGTIEKRLLDVIATERLYRMGRFETTEDSEVSIGWVSIGRLLNTSGLLPAVIESFSAWIEERVNNIGCKSERVLLVGMDCWGGILASELSVTTGARNVCIAVRGGGKHYTGLEQISETVTEMALASEIIILISDVVATGRSLRRVYDQLHNAPNAGSALKAQWYGLSIICDALAVRTVDCGFLAEHGTLCARLRMPLIPQALMPPRDMLPAMLSLFGTDK